MIERQLYSNKALTATNKSLLISLLHLAAFICILVNSRGVCATFGSPSVNYHFETFNPYSLVRFFEFSDKGWVISENCLKDLYVYVQGLKNGAVWASKLYDANGYYGGGGFNGSTIRVHNPNICHSLRQEYSSLRSSLHKLLQSPFNVNRTVVPFEVQLIMGKYLLQLSKHRSNQSKGLKIQQQICLPSSCNNKDLQQILDVQLYQANLLVHSISYIDHRILNPDYNVLNEMDFYALIILLFGALLIYVLVWLAGQATSHLSSYKVKANRCNNIFAACLFNNEASIKESIGEELYNQITHSEERIYNFSIIPTKLHFENFLQSIKIKGIIRDLVKPVEQERNPQVGLQVYFTILYIYAHLGNELSIIANNLDHSTIQKENFVLKHYTFILDVHFFLSGLKLANKFMKTFPKEKHNVFEQILHLLKLIVEKLTCITPSYSFCLFAAYLLDKHLQQNGVIEIPSFDYRYCQQQKLRNLFYVDTFYPLQNRCMPWTWLISLEVQFFIVSCFILLLTEINKEFGIAIGFVMYAVSTIASTFWEFYSSQNNGQSQLSVQPSQDLMQFNLVYPNTCLRILPYIVGICVGSIMHKNEFKVKINIFLLLCGWVACCLLIWYFQFGYDQILSSVSGVAQACIATTAHTFWIFMLAWTVLTIISQYGGVFKSVLCFKYAQTLETLAPINLIITPLLIRLFIFTMNAPVYTSSGQILVLAIGCVITVFTCAFILHVLLDGPLKAVLKTALWKNC